MHKMPIEIDREPWELYILDISEGSEIYEFELFPSA